MEVLWFFRSAPVAFPWCFRVDYHVSMVPLVLSKALPWGSHAWCFCGDCHVSMVLPWSCHGDFGALTGTFVVLSWCFRDADMVLPGPATLFHFFDLLPYGSFH